MSESTHLSDLDDLEQYPPLVLPDGELELNPQDLTISDFEHLEHAQGARIKQASLILITIGMMVSMLLAALDQTIVSTAIRTIGDDLHGYNMQAWVTTAYLITSTIVTPLYGKLSDIFGRRPLYLFCIVIFLLGSILCSMVHDMTQLTLARAIQGIGGGGIISLSLTVIGDIATPRNRPKYQGAFVAVFAMSSVLGPLLGGLFAGQSTILGIAGWRWVFLVNAPVGCVALIMIFLYLKYDLPKLKHKVDFSGAIALCVNLIPLLLVASQGQEWGWLGGKSLLCYALTIIGFVAFIVIEKSKKEAAILPMRVFKTSTFSLGVLVSVASGAELFGGAALIPQYFQVVRGYNPTIAGLLSVPQVLGMMGASLGSGILISRTGRYHKTLIAGGIAGILAFIALGLLDYNTAVWQVLLISAVLGFGLGCLMQPSTIAIQNSLPKRDISISTAAATFFRSIGGTLGVAAVMSVLFMQLGGSINAELQKSASDPQFKYAIAHYAMGNSGNANNVNTQFARSVLTHNPKFFSGLLKDTETIDQLDAQFKIPIKRGFTDAIDSSFIFVLVLAVIGFILILLWKERPITLDEKSDDMHFSGGH